MRAKDTRSDRSKRGRIALVCAMLLAVDLACLAIGPESRRTMTGRFVHLLMFGGRTSCYFGPRSYVVQMPDGTFHVLAPWQPVPEDDPVLAGSRVVENIIFAYHVTCRGFHAPTSRSYSARIVGPEWIKQATPGERAKIRWDFARSVLSMEKYRAMPQNVRQSVLAKGDGEHIETLWFGYVHNGFSLSVALFLIWNGGFWLVTWRPARRWPRHCCANCGYDLRATAHVRCPECGVEQRGESR